MTRQMVAVPVILLAEPEARDSLREPVGRAVEEIR
jgi:hypothetical protein